MQLQLNQIDFSLSKTSLKSVLYSHFYLTVYLQRSTCGVTLACIIAI